MCNEYKLKLVDGRWVWMRMSHARRLVQKKQADLFAPEPAAPTNEDHYHIFPDSFAPVIRRAKDGGYESVEMRWGFPPPREGGELITNARNLESPYWRPWILKRWRCLVPVSEFCEWTDERPKQRRWFRLKDNEGFCFAGVWRTWEGVRGGRDDRESGEHEVFAFVTTEANDIVRPIHAKAMPLILPRERWDEWLDVPPRSTFLMQAASFPAERMAQPGETTLPD